MSTQERVIAVIAEVLDIPAAEITPEARFVEDLGASSLDIVDFVMRIEQSFGLSEIPESALSQVQSVADIVALIDGAGSTPTRAAASQKSATVAVDVALASDHAGVGLKAALVRWLVARGLSVYDAGPEESVAVDYPDYALRVSRQVAQSEARFGVLVCGSGVGMSIAANKVAGVRAALVSEPVSASLSRQHNDANVLCLGARIIGEQMALECLRAFVDTAYEPGDDGRHQRRVDQIADIEKRPGH